MTEATTQIPGNPGAGAPCGETIKLSLAAGTRFRNHHGITQHHFICRIQNKPIRKDRDRPHWLLPHDGGRRCRVAAFVSLVAAAQQEQRR